MTHVTAPRGKTMVFLPSRELESCHRINPKKLNNIMGLTDHFDRNLAYWWEDFGAVRQIGGSASLEALAALISYPTGILRTGARGGPNAVRSSYEAQAGD